MLTEQRRKEIETRVRQDGELKEYTAEYLAMKEQITHNVMEFIESFSDVLMIVADTYKNDVELLLAEIDRLKGEPRKD